MPYVALKWDHRCAEAWIRWIVVECASVGQLHGGPQAIAPRRDVAYFVHEESAERDARAFAALKSGEPALPAECSATAEQRYVAFPWDHALFNPLIAWAVLTYVPGIEGRHDVAYFLDGTDGESDARGFCELVAPRT